MASTLIECRYKHFIGFDAHRAPLANATAITCPDAGQELGKPAVSLDEWVIGFDTEKFAGQVKESGAPYVFVTMMQRTRYLIAPNSTYDRYGVDGDPATDAQASGSYAWTYEVDLLRQSNITRVAITFGKSHATQFQVQVSTDRKTWQVLADVTHHDGSKWLQSFPPAAARYVRVRALKPDGPNQAGGQMSVAELEVYQ